MYLLNILDNEVLHLVAETGVIVIGSLLLGILLAYLHWGSYKKRVAQLNNQVDFERNQVADLNLAVAELTAYRNNLADEVENEKNKINYHSKTIYQQQEKIRNDEAKLQQLQSTVVELNAQISSYQQRLNTIEQNIFQLNETPPVHHQIKTPQVASINYDHVSSLLGKSVTENDLTMIVGIGPRTASLLESIGIDTWEILGRSSVQHLQNVLNEAGGVYRSLDPSHWPKQAVMAAQSEWRKLRVFQETLRKQE